MRCWDKELVGCCFNPQEAKCIFTIPISLWGCPDKKIWHFNSHGAYTVRSGYEVALTLRRNGELGRKAEGETSQGDTQRRIWKSIWGVQVPPKIRTFLWKCCRNVLAVKENLRHRGLDVDTTCALCGQETETQVHLFFKCEFARVLWFASPLQLDPCQILGEDFSGCWEHLLKKYEQEEHCRDILQVCAFGLWRIWKTRNGAVFEGMRIDPLDAVECYQNQVQEFRTAQMRIKPLINSLPRPPEAQAEPVTSWRKPPYGMFKVNCDAAWVSQSQMGGVGWVVRDSFGWMVHAGGKGNVRGASTLVMEAEAIREALMACVHGGLSKLEVEYDSLLLIRMLCGDWKIDTSVEAIIFDIKQLVVHLQQCVFMYAPRLCNKAAHKIAAFVSRVGGIHTWDDLWPEWIFDILARDVNLTIRL
ncbi:hypothetical protein ACE6H2_006913 [Prunus campanulata]